MTKLDKMKNKYLRITVIVLGTLSLFLMLSACDSRSPGQTTVTTSPTNVPANPLITEGEWQLISEVQSDVYYKALSFPDEKNGWVVGDSGRILHTHDGGYSWQAQDSGTSFDLQCIYFATNTIGWIGGSQNSIGHTIDGGASWIWQHPEGEPRRTFMAMSFVDQNTGWIVDNFGGILHTKDGGATWIPQSSGTQWAITSVQFLNANEGWGTATNRIALHTTDGGENWITTDLNGLDYGGTVIFEDVFFVDTDNGWITTNIMASSQSSTYEAGAPLLHTTDGGRTWFIQANIPDYSAGQVRFVDTQVGWLAGFYSILSTEDGGNSWSSEISGGNDSFQDICLLDNLQLWAMTFTGKIYVTGRASNISGGNDYATVKYDNNGKELWENRYKGNVNGLNEASDIFVDEKSNTYITGESSLDGQYATYDTIKYDSQGKQVWATKSNKVYFTDRPADLVVDRNGNVFITGTILHWDANEQ